MDISERSVASLRQGKDLSAISGSLCAILSALVFTFASLSARQALAVAEVLNQVSEQGKSKYYYWQTPGFDLERFEAGRLNGELAVVVGTILLVIALVVLCLSWRVEVEAIRADITLHRRHRILTVGGFLFGALSLLLLVNDIIWLWQIHLIPHLWPHL